MSKKTTDIISYITPIGLILAFLLGDRENSRFHINQALVIWLAGVIVGVAERLLENLPVVGIIVAIACAVASIALLVFWIKGLVSACKGTEEKVPVIGDIVLFQ